MHWIGQGARGGGTLYGRSAIPTRLSRLASTPPKRKRGQSRVRDQAMPEYDYVSV